MTTRIGGEHVSGATGGTTPAIDTTGATLLVAKVSHWNNELTGTVSDSKGNLWVALTDQASGAGSRSRIFYCLDPIVGSGHTCTFGSPGAAALFAVLEFEAFGGGTFTLDAANSSSGAATVQPGSVTPSAASNVVVTATSSTDEGTVSVNSGFTLTYQTPQTGGEHFGFGGAYKLDATGAQNPTWSYGSSDPTAATIAVFSIGDTPPTPGFTPTVSLNAVSVVSTATPGTLPITGTTYQYDYPNGSPTAATTHDYGDEELGDHTIRQFVTDGTNTVHIDHDITTASRFRYRSRTLGGYSAESNTVDRPDA